MKNKRDGVQYLVELNVGYSVFLHMNIRFYKDMADRNAAPEIRFRK